MSARNFAALAAALMLLTGPGSAAAQTVNQGTQLAQQGQAVQQRAARVPLEGLPEAEMRRRINAWVVGVAAGKLEGTPVRLVEEMSRVLDDGENMQVLPIITRGPSYNVHALLYLRGIDLAVINGDVLDYFGKVKKIPLIQQRINYITQLFNSEVHVLARPEIRSLKDLAGKNVNFNTKGTSAAFTGPVVFDRLGIKIKKTFVPHPIAMQEMKTSKKYAAVVFVTGKPVRPLVKKKWPKGFHLLPVPYSSKMADHFLPSTLDPKDYPKLIKAGKPVRTIAVPTVLAAFNWSTKNPRYQRVKKFVDYLFDRWDRLQKKPFHPKWRDINLAAEIPGWRRLPMVQQKLNERRIAAQQQATRNATAATVQPYDRQTQEQLFNEFLKWYNQREARQR